MRPSSTTPLVATAPGVVVFGEFADETQGSLNGDDTDEEPCFSRARKRATALAKKYQLVICFAVAIAVGLAFPTPGVHAGKKYGGVSPFANICVMLIFFLNGLKLKPRCGSMRPPTASPHLHCFIVLSTRGQNPHVTCASAIFALLFVDSCTLLFPLYGHHHRGWLLLLHHTSISVLIKSARATVHRARTETFTTRCASGTGCCLDCSQSSCSP